MFALNKQFESQLIPDLCYSGNANSSYTMRTPRLEVVTETWIIPNPVKQTHAYTRHSCF